MATIKDLKFDDKNFNKHTEYGMSLLEKSLRENGAGRSILLDKDNNIIAGNGIVEAAGQIGLEKVKVVEATGDEIIAVKRTDISLNSKKGREMALADNATAAVDLEWDEDAIKSEFDEDEVKEWGVELDWDDEQEVEEDEAPEVDESEPPKSVLGGVYQLGRHRLMCGDSTDAGSVAILMDGKKAEMVFTDPPYGIDVVKGSKVGGEKIAKVNTYSSIIGDDTTDTAKKNYEIVKKISENQIIFGGNYFTDFLPPSRCWCVWDKQNTGNFADVELAWTSFEKGAKIYHYMWNGLAREGSRELELSKRVHPTQKPVGMVMKILGDLSPENSIVVDCFGGSGSTLIACEQLGRKCYMMEPDPKYCDVIRKRYWKFTTGSEEGWEDGTKAI